MKKRRKAPLIELRIGELLVEISHEQIGDKFAEVLKEWLTPSQWTEMRGRNYNAPPGICASHDFCDANMAMHDAFIHFGLNPLQLGRESEDSGMADEVGEVWGAAWDYAKHKHLTGA